MSSKPALCASGLSKCYQIYARPQDRLLQTLWRGRRQYYREFWALRDVSFELGRGEAVGVIGRNGSGKSTLLQLLAGTLTPTRGQVQTNGRIAALLELGSGFNPEFTGRENIAMNAAILGLGRGDVQRRMPDIEAFADIGDFIDQPVKTYSSGMVMRLAFAVSVHVEPEILIVDEALAVGDMAFQFRCLERLHRLVRSGTTLLFVSHDVGMVKAFCSRALYLVEGRLRGVGAPDEIADMYVEDSRELQRETLVSRAPAQPSRREARGDPASRHSRVVEARFLDSPPRPSFAHGEAIRFEVAVELQGELNRPAITALVQDRRMIGIAGKACHLAPGRGARLAKAQFSVPALFEAGSYFVTFRLEDRMTAGTFMVAEKRSGLLEFEMLRKTGPDFVGLVDLAMAAAEISDSADNAGKSPAAATVR